MEQSAFDIGSRIQDAREQRGLTRQDICEATKLSPLTVVAIEENKFERLPGGMFRVAYVRIVATAVGLDPEHLARAYRAAYEAQATPPPAPVRATTLPRWISLGLVAGVVATLWLSSRSTPPEADGGHLEASRIWSQLTALPVAIAEAKEVTAHGAEIPPHASTLQLDLRVTEACWVSLFADGERVIYKLMQAGDQTSVEAQEAITLRVGNAGAVAYSLNGVAGQPLGGAGEVATLRLTKADVGRS